MKQSEIKITVQLDDDRVPEQLFWEATESGIANATPTKAMTLSVWDSAQKGTLRIDLWTKDMPIDEMKQFYIDTIGGLGQSLKGATNDEVMFQKIAKLCNELMKDLEAEIKSRNN